MPAPLDLIYLDEECRVIDMAESFPTFQVSSSSPRPESVLALAGALDLFVADTVGRSACAVRGRGDGAAVGEVYQYARRSRQRPVIAGAALLREKPLVERRAGTAGTGRPQWTRQAGCSCRTHSMDLTAPGAKTKGQLRTWFERWWSPDPRKAPRVKEPGLAAYYWNGAAPAAHGVRDISSSGLYVVTEERWYPGTLVLMTLQKTDRGEEYPERSIAVQSRAVRWGPDGVGLQFVLADEKDARNVKAANLDMADSKDLESFLEQLKKGE